MPIKIAINGFGRIGRAAYKIMHDNNEIEVVAINDLLEPKTLLTLLKYDTAYGKFGQTMSIEEGNLIVDGKKTKLLSEKDPLKLPWKDLNVDVVLECTGKFEKDGTARTHITAGARKVVISAPAEGTGDIQTFLLGVNDSAYANQDVISNASCTTNCIAPAIAVIQNNIGIKKALMTTAHALTATQNLIDGPSKDPRRARAAGYNIIPTTTGAAISTTEVITELQGKFDGLSLRVPILVGSISDITMLVQRPTSKEEINDLYLKAKDDPKYKGVIEATYDPIVSSDIVKSTFSCIIDLSMTKVVDGDLVKILAWYDNEWGYSNRLVEMALLVAKA